MILTCPACDTKYVVKDGAIPPHGRQVRCASCKHSWHQEPELVLAEPASDAEIDFGGPPPPRAEPASSMFGRSSASSSRRTRRLSCDGLAPDAARRVPGVAAGRRVELVEARR